MRKSNTDVLIMPAAQPALSTFQQYQVLQQSDLFDRRHYLECNPDVGEADLDPLLHYIEFGAAEGRAPNPGFDVDFYREQCELAGFTFTNPLLHYLLEGRKKGLALNRSAAATAAISAAASLTPTKAPRKLKVPGKQDAALIEKSGLFDAAWYAKRYRQPASEALHHYLHSGAANLNDPSQNFSTAFYLERYADVASAGINPLLHYVTTGRHEGRHPNSQWGNFALVVHAFHLDVLDDLVAHTTHFPIGRDQYVTHPEEFTALQVQTLKKYFPSAQLVSVKNFGQDVGALMQLSEKVNLRQYGFICKVHTKKGQKHPVEWRRALLRGVLGSPSQVQNTIKAFQNNSSVALAGARQLFIYGPNNLRKNGDNLRQYFASSIGKVHPETVDWGFIGGTCFWARTSLLLSVCEQMRKLNLAPATYTDDGTPAHAAERMFGLLATLRGEKVLLNDALNPQSAGALVSGFPPPLSRGLFTVAARLGTAEVRKALDIDDMPAPTAAATATAPAPAGDAARIRGDLNVTADRPVISGWLAKIGDSQPREALIRCAEVELRVIANNFRGDLQKNGINQGSHAFSLSAPSQLLDGVKREIQLLDAATGKEIIRRVCQWQRPKRPYSDFEGFLKASLTQPLIEAPFAEEDKRCFALMEGVARQLIGRTQRLDKAPLVSVIMPVYNREGFVAQAIASVLAQDYRNFELIVVDDGSTDESVNVVKRFKDKRIKPIWLKRNAGHSAARNAGLEKAAGEIVAYLDSDNSWDRRYLSATVGAFDALPDADAVYSGQLLYRGTATEPFAVRYGHLNYSLLQNQNYIDLNSFAHRNRELAGEPIRFDATLKRFVDYDLIMRVAEAGRLVSVPVLLCNYFFDKAENTVTNSSKHAGDMQVVRQRLAARTKSRLAAADQRQLEHPVAVVIPNWESLEDIEACLDALDAYGRRGMLEVIVVDNNSSHDVVKFLRSRAKAGKIRLIVNKQNFGFTYAVNQGIAAAHADADILLLNNDAVVLPGAILELQRACYSLPGAGMTMPRQILPPGTKTVRVHVPYANEENDCDVNISAHHMNVGPVPMFHDGKVLELTYAPFFATYVRRDVIDAIGPLDAEYGRHYRSDRTYCDLMRNSIQRRIYYVPDAQVIHKLQKATEILRDKAVQNGEFELMFKRNQWDKATAEKLGFRIPPWDIF